ncbi:nucleotidyl transferase AbiEii/AbiGii toxin family protein [Candidatus Woesearchaeota archaeon]|nr:nucleotidyl transferase AbiEii/AbiGii toxin family protein [Candidatus Woesearchaeota archaeon]
MITKKELIKIAKNSELNLYQQEKEYLLKLFLYYYYKKFEDAIFKGGTAIKFTKSLNRFSEDLDFNINITPKKFQEQINLTLKEIEKIGIKNSFIKIETFEKAFTCEIEFQGPLYEGTKQTRNKFRIDAGIRTGTISKPIWILINSEYPETKEIFIIKIMNLEEILCEKIITIFQRNKGRDVYDVWFLLNSNIKLNKKLLKKKLGNKKLNKKDFTKETEYNRDLKHLTPRIIPYSQIKKEVLEQIKGIIK